MANYVEASTQTEWAGLMQKNVVRPDLCSPAPYPNTSTPPEEPITNKQQTINDLASVSLAEQRGQPQTPPQSKEQYQDAASTMSTSPLLARRQNRPDFVPHIDLPSPDMKATIEALDDEVPVSPPPSALVLSPLPEANRRFAGHTPLYVGSPNDTSKEVTPKRQASGRLDINPIVPKKLQPLPVHELVVEQDPSEDADTERDADRQLEESPSRTPQEDVGLTGPLALAPNPGDGTQDNHILLGALDDRLSKVAQEREEALAKLAQQQPQHHLEDAAEDEQPRSRQGSADSRASEVPGIDGVTFKKTVPLNFGAPIGTV